ncbi:thiamine pyrophosphokinase [Aspergillus karnatakaensis]|uniref:thiamine diphosphokinase n=1 Tax=Aspergillus karnatakaensis TaxID=1810916 RepID=UPI003CCC9EB7
MEWDPTIFFREDVPTIPPFALVVTNQPLNEKALAVLRNHARITVCADGGANRFFEWAKSRGVEGTDIPNTIIGDLDSIRPDVRAHYESLGVDVILDDDQYSTDLTKSLRYLRDQEKEILSATEPVQPQAQPLRPESKPESQAPRSTTATTTPAPEKADSETLSILILGGLGGRVDQAFSQIHHLYLMNQEQERSKSQGTMYLISEESITFILAPGKNTIHVPRANRPLPPSSALESQSQSQSSSRETKQEYLLEENIGIIPLSGAESITTKGFEWDVENWRTEIGGQLSTSNHIRAERVEVSTGGPVLFTVELAGGLKRGS